MKNYKKLTRKITKSAANIVTSRSTLPAITNTMFICHVHYTKTIQSVTKPQQKDKIRKRKI